MDGRDRPARWPCTVLRTVGALLLCLAVPDVVAAQTPDILDTVTLRFRNAATVWMDTLHPLGLRTLVLVSGVEFAIAASLWVVHESDGPGSLQAQFLRKFTWLTFWYSVAFSWELWIPPIWNSFAFAGQTGSGLASLNPSAIVDTGIDLHNRMYDAASTLLLWDPTTAPIIVLAIFATDMAFFLMAIAICYTIIQGFLVMGAGVLFLGMAGWRSTAQMTDNYLNLVVYTGIKLMTLYLLVGVAMTVGDDMVNALGNASWFDVGPVFTVLVTALVLCSLVTGLPIFLARGITAGQQFGLVSAVRAKDR
jgi:P-type conjugative transfer protein TrbL